MSTWNSTISREFWQDFNALPADVTNRTKRSINRMLEDPWAPELHPERVKSADIGVHSCRVDDNYRIIWKHIKPNDIVFCLVDKHDDAYRRASRKSFKLEDGLVKIADILEIGGKAPAASGGLFGWGKPKDGKIGTLFVGYRDRELLEWGVPKDVLPNVRTLEDANQLPGIERLLPAPVYDKLISIALGIIDRPAIPDDQLRQSLTHYQGGDDLYRFINSEEFHRALAGDMQEWMLFLAPPQRYLVARNYNGPARVKGVAGSGKTVVAIHRARRLSQEAVKQEKKILFLTYGNRLPGIVHKLLEHLAGEGVTETSAVECCTIHQWCARFLKNLNVNLKVDNNLQQEALVSAVDLTRPVFANLPLWQRPPAFFSDEISYAIKGRRVRSLEEYLGLDRSGRGTPLGERERQAVYAVYQNYQDNLASKGACDFDDFILKSLDAIESKLPPPPYLAAVVDEIQDLTAATLTLIRSIVPPGPNDLFLVGDGLQRIYPGGYSLNRLSIDVTGRGAILRRNYRNTHEILRMAHAVTKSLAVDDLDDESVEAVEPEYSVRHGELPLLCGFHTPEQEISWLSEEIDRLQRESRYHDADFAILYRWRSPYQELLGKILGKQAELVELQRDPDTYFGSGIKHSTFQSAKGMEFKVVFIVGATDGQFVPKDDWTLEGKELEDYLTREQRLLYAALTRARDLLYITYARGKSSRFLDSVPQSYYRKENR